MINSFLHVKNDIIKIKDELFNLSQQQAEILQKLEELDIGEINLKQELKETATIKPLVQTKRAKKHYVASKTGKDFHIEECPFAQNIKPRSKVRFKSTTAAQNAGYKPCNCVK